MSDERGGMGLPRRGPVDLDNGTLNEYIEGLESRLESVEAERDHEKERADVLAYDLDRADERFAKEQEYLCGVNAAANEAAAKAESRLAKTVEVLRRAIDILDNKQSDGRTIALLRTLLRRVLAEVKDES